MILSPGVAPHLKIFEYARQQGIKITGEFEFSSAFIKEPTVAITSSFGAFKKRARPLPLTWFTETRVGNVGETDWRKS